jgi:PAS domain S-box-containing protein
MGEQVFLKSMGEQDLPARTDSPAPILNRPAALGILVFIILAGLFTILIYQRFLIVQEAKKKEAYDIVNTAKDKLQEVLAYSASATKILTFLIDNNGGVKNFDSVAAQILSTNKDLDALELVPDGVVRYIYPLKGNEKIMGYDLLKDPARSKEAFKAIEKNDLFFSGPYQLKQGGIGIVGRLPVYRNKKFWGFSAVIIKLPTLLKAARIDSIDRNGNYFQLSKINPDTKKEELFIPHGKEHLENYAISVDVPNGEWKLSVHPSAGYKKLADIFILALLGFLISVFGAVFVYSIAGRPQLLNNLVKERTAQLKESEEKFSRAFHSNVLGFAIYDEEFRIVDINGPYAAILEKPRNELIGKTSDEAGLISKINIARRENISQEIEVILNVDGQLSNYETEIETNEGSLATVLLSIERLELNNKKHWLTTIIDITAKKKAELLLKESEEKYRTLIEQASDGIVITDFDGIILEVNNSICIMSGYDEDEMLGEHLHKFLPVEDVTVNPLRLSDLMQGKSLLYERRLMRKDGTTLDIEVNSKMATSHTLIGFIRDIGDRKKNEETLQYQARLLESVSDAVTSLDLNRRIVSWNKACEELYGLGAEEVLGKRVPELVTFEFNNTTTEEVFKQVYSDGQWKGEFNFIHPKTGAKTHLLSSLNVLKSKEGEITGLILTSKDITERKKAEEETRKSNERFELIAQATNEAIWDHDFQRNETWGNKTLYDLYGVESGTAKINFEMFVERIHPDERNKVLERMRGAIENTVTSLTEEFRFRTADGEYKNFYDRAYIKYDETGKPLKILGAMQDITERENAKKAILESEEKYRTLVEQASDGIFIADSEGRFLIVNSSGYNLSQYSREELSKLTIYDLVLPEDLKKEPFHFSEMRDNKVARAERRMRRKDGTLIDVEVTAKFISGNRFLAFVRDVSERKKAEKELTESFSILEATLESTTDGILVVNAQGRINRYNKKFTALWGIPQDILATGDDNKAIAFVLDQLKEPEKFIAKVKELYNQPEAVSYDILEFKDGRVFERYSQPQYIKGQSSGRVWSFRDITERKKAEEELFQSEQKYRLLFHNNPLPMWMATIPGLDIIEVNNAAIEKYGYTREEFLKLNTRQLRPAEDVENYLKEVAKMDPSIINTRTWRDIKKDGTIMQVETHSHQIMYEGRPVWFGLTNDVTEKFKAKELLQNSYEEIRQLASNLQSIREDERTNIAREIHDELGQQLTGLKMDIHWLSRKLTNADAEMNAKMKESIELINATITSVRKIATDLRPSILDDLGLVAALEWQGEEFEKRSGTKVKFINQAGDLALKPEVATGIFRIYQELLTNIARHANARAVTASLQIDEENTLRFSIKDNGVGFNADTIGNKKTLGLLGIKERTLLMGGTYEIKTEPGKGSETIISIPLNLTTVTG